MFGSWDVLSWGLPIVTQLDNVHVDNAPANHAALQYLCSKRYAVPVYTVYTVQTDPGDVGRMPGRGRISNIVPRPVAPQPCPYGAAYHNSYDVQLQHAD